ncbi:MAG: hypothetical protein ACRYFS_21395 [Janthinobacterium lividum]
MDPDKKARADSLFRNVQMAHVKGIVELHHASTREQTLENYQSTFKSFTTSPQATRTPERVQRFMQREVSVITDLLALSYDSDKPKMLASLNAIPGLLDRMPLITNI